MGLLVKFIWTGKFKMFVNEKLPFKTNPAKDGIFDFPIFHHSIIPCATQKPMSLKFVYSQQVVEIPRR